MRKDFGDPRDRVGNGVPLVRPDLVLSRAVIDHVVVRCSREAKELVELVFRRIAIADVQREFKRGAQNFREPAGARGGLTPVSLVGEDGRDRPGVVVLGA